MNERDQAWVTANRWLDGKINPLVEVVPGDPDCDALVLARQYIRARDREDAVPQSFIREFMEHRRFWAAKDIDIIARKDGHEYRLEGDWLKPFVRALSAIKSQIVTLSVKEKTP